MLNLVVKRFKWILVGFAIILCSCTTPPNVPNIKQNITPEDISSSLIGARIYINSGSFGPSIVHIKVGQGVEWIWDNYLETDQVIIKNLASSPIQNTGTWAYVFKKPGTYYFYSPFHYEMQGEVIVTK